LREVREAQAKAEAAQTSGEGADFMAMIDGFATGDTGSTSQALGVQSFVPAVKLLLHDEASGTAQRGLKACRGRDRKRELVVKSPIRLPRNKRNLHPLNPHSRFPRTEVKFVVVTVIDGPPVRGGWKDACSRTSVGHSLHVVRTFWAEVTHGRFYFEQPREVANVRVQSTISKDDLLELVAETFEKGGVDPSHANVIRMIFFENGYPSSWQSAIEGSVERRSTSSDAKGQPVGAFAYSAAASPSAVKIKNMVMSDTCDSSSLLHEFGHLLGLGHSGTPMKKALRTGWFSSHVINGNFFGVASEYLDLSSIMSFAIPTAVNDHQRRTKRGLNSIQLFNLGILREEHIVTFDANSKSGRVDLSEMNPSKAGFLDGPFRAVRVQSGDSFFWVEWRAGNSRGDDDLFNIYNTCVSREAQQGRVWGGMLVRHLAHSNGTATMLDAIIPVGKSVVLNGIRFQHSASDEMLPTVSPSLPPAKKPGGLLKFIRLSKLESIRLHRRNRT